MLNKSLADLYSESDYVVPNRKVIAQSLKELNDKCELPWSKKTAAPKTNVEKGYVAPGRPKQLGEGAFEGRGGDSVIPDVNSRGVSKDKKYVSPPDIMGQPEQEFELQGQDPAVDESALAPLPQAGAPAISDSIQGYQQEEIDPLYGRTDLAPPLEELDLENEEYKRQFKQLPFKQQQQLLAKAEHDGLSPIDAIRNHFKGIVVRK